MSCELIGAMLVAVGERWEPINPPARHECRDTFSAGNGYTTNRPPFLGWPGGQYSADCTYEAVQVYIANRKKVTKYTYVLEYQCCNLEGNCCIVRDWCYSEDEEYSWFPGNLDGDYGDPPAGWRFSNINSPQGLLDQEDKEEIISSALQFQQDAFQQWYEDFVQDCADAATQAGTIQGAGCP